MCVVCEIFAKLSHFTLETLHRWSLPGKPESNLCLSIHIVAITCQLLFEFSIWALNFACFKFRDCITIPKKAKLKTCEIRGGQYCQLLILNQLGTPGEVPKKFRGTYKLIKKKEVR